MDLDEIYTQIGEFGPLQRIYFLSLSIFNLYPPFNMIQIVFTGQAPSFKCLGFNGTELKDSCPMNNLSQCETITYNVIPDTFAREWGLVCDQKYKTNFLQSIFFAGVMVGALVFGPIADSFGRKYTLLATTIGLVVSGVTSSFMSTYYLYAVARCFNGFFTAGNMLSCFVLSSELVGPSKRGVCGNIFQAFFAIGIIAYSILGYFVSSWRNLSLISGCLGLIFLPSILWIPESPRWLITHGKSEEARKILTRIAIRNKTRLPAGAHDSKDNNNVHGHNIGLKHVFRSPKICFVTLIQLFSWFVNSVVYYGLTLAAGDLGSNIYMSEALSGAVELPAYVIATLLIEWSGRRRPLAAFMMLGGIACLAVKWSTTLFLPLFGKLAIAASFSIIYIHSAELFPTVIRNSGLGLCSCFARIGGIISPLTSFANSYTPSGQFLILGALSFTSGFLNLWLPETLKKPMPETIQDLESLLSGYAEVYVDDETDITTDDDDQD